MKKSNTFLVIGDTIAIAIITAVGFATHGEVSLAYLPRMGTTFFPLLISWFLIAPWLGVFDSQISNNLRQLWRPALAMVFAAPMAAILRAATLNAPALPLFTFFLGLTSALMMVIWRAIYGWLFKRVE